MRASSVRKSCQRTYLAITCNWVHVPTCASGSHSRNTFSPKNNLGHVIRYISLVQISLREYHHRVRPSMAMDIRTNHLKECATGKEIYNF